MGEVDQFLDEVEAELARLTKENDDLSVEAVLGPGRLRPERPGARGEGLRARPDRGAGPRAYRPGPRGRGGRQPGRDDPRRDRAPRRRTPRPACSRSRRATPTSSSTRPRTTPTRSWARPARRPSASRPSPRRKSDRLEADARTRAQMLDSETAERRQQMFGDLEKERDKLSSEVENLRSFEREYRSRLKSYFTQQLEALNGSAETAAPFERRAAGPQAAPLDPRRGRRLSEAQRQHHQARPVPRDRPCLRRRTATWLSLVGEGLPSVPTVRLSTEWSRPGEALP